MAWPDLLRTYLPGGAYGLLFLAMGGLIVAFIKGWIVSGATHRKVDATNQVLVDTVRLQAETLEELKAWSGSMAAQLQELRAFHGLRGAWQPRRQARRNRMRSLRPCGTSRRRSLTA